MANKRLYEDRVLTNSEKSRRHAVKIASIDEQLNEALKNINIKRKAKGSSSFLSFICTYCVGILLDTAPSGMMIDVINQMEQSITSITPTMLELFRGCGKSSIAECLMLYILACKSDIHKVCLIVSQNARSSASILKDCQRLLEEPDTAFAQDFPNICLPFQLGGNGRKLQTYNGISTDIAKNATCIQLPRLVKEDGTEYPSSGAVLVSKPITSCRGTKYGKNRVSFCLIDDIQTLETASNPEQVHKILDLINKDIFNLAGQGQKLTVMMTATPLAEDDVCEMIEHSKIWKTIKYKAILQYPKDIIEHGGLWDRYFELYDSEVVNDKPHTESLEYYRNNFEAMNAGCKLFNNTFSSKDGHIHGLQKLLEKRHTIGNSAFECEFQMNIIKNKFALQITPTEICKKINNFQKLEIPDEYRYVTASIDINSSFALTLVISAWKIDTTGIVVYKDIIPCTIDQQLPTTQYNQQLYQKLESVCNFIASLGIKINSVAIDAGGRNFDCVCLFAKNYRKLPVCAFLGRASTQFNLLMYSKTRLRNAIGRTILCGDDAERAKSGSGIKYCYWDADWGKEAIQIGLLAVVGDVGSISLYHAEPEEHQEFAIQISNEKLISKVQKQDGRCIYTWRTKEQNHYCDCLAMNRASLAVLGVSENNFDKKSVSKMMRTQFRKRAKIRIV